MKRVPWWTLLGVSGTGLTALLLAQSVWGQPDPRVPLPPPTPIIQPEIPVPKSGDTKPAPAAPMVEVPQFPPMPLFTDPVPTPKVQPPLPKTLALPSAQAPLSDYRPAPSGPQPVKTEPTGTVLPAPKLEKIAPAPVSLEVPPGRQQPAVSIEWAGPTSVRVNQPISCQIVVRNTSTTPAQNVIVRHRLGQGVACKSSEPTAGNEADDLVWNLGTLAPQQTKRVELVLVSQARGALNCSASVTFTAVAGHQVQVREPQLAIKMTGPSKVISGENVTILLAISNPGDGAAEAVAIKAILPDGVEHPRGKSLEFKVGTLAPKETRNMQLVCQTKGSGPQTCAINVTGEGGLQANDTTQFEILMPKLEVAMSGPKLRYLDRHAVYVLKVTNPGNAPASKVEVQQAIPAGFKFHQANAGGQFQEATRLVSWSLGDLLPGQTKDIAVDLIPIAPGEHQLIAHVKAARGLKSQADARTMVEGLPSLFIEVGHVDDPLEIGAETTFEIHLTNTGTKAETNVEVVCTLPEQLEFRGAKTSTTMKCRQEGRELIFDSLAKLAPKADVIYRVQVRGIAAGDVRFRTRIKSDGLKEPVLREESIRVYSDGTPVRPATFTAPAPIAPLPKESVPAPLSAPSSSLPLPAPTPTPSLLIPAPTPIAPPGVSVPAPVPVPSPSVPLPTPIPAPMPIAPPVPMPVAPMLPTPIVLPAPG